MNKKDLILYVHGWNSHANARKAKLIESELRNHEVFETSSITLRNHPREVIKQLTEYISEKQNEYNIHLVGSSLGGYYSVFLAETLNLKATMINPAVWAYKIFENDRGENENPNTGEKYFIDQDWVDGLEEAVGWKFRLVSDAYIVNGIGNIMCDCMEGLSTPEVEALQWEDFAPLGRYLSQQRKQGMQAILNKCKRIVRGE